MVACKSSKWQKKTAYNIFIDLFVTSIGGYIIMYILHNPYHLLATPK